MAKQPDRDPDHLLAPEGFDELNERFYSRRPTDYFASRFAMAALLAAKPDEVSALFKGGWEYGTLKFKPSDVEDADEDEDEERRRREAVVIAESEVLLHRATETLLRLFLAHRGLPQCPPLEMARVRTPGEFKTRLQDELVDVAREDLADDVAELFHGFKDRSDFGDEGPPEDMWNDSIRSITEWLVYLAGRWLADAQLYNSAKHGFGVGAGEWGFTFHTPENVPDLGRVGPGIEWLEIGDHEGRRKWLSVMRFTLPDLNLGMCDVVVSLMGKLWTVAAVRYTEEPLSKGFSIGGYASPQRLIDDALAKWKPFILTGWTSPLSYYLDEDEPEDEVGGPGAA